MVCKHPKSASFHVSEGPWGMCKAVFLLRVYEDLVTWPALRYKVAQHLLNTCPHTCPTHGLRATSSPPATFSGYVEGVECVVWAQQVQHESHNVSYTSWARRTLYRKQLLGQISFLLILELYQTWCCWVLFDSTLCQPVKAFTVDHFPRTTLRVDAKQFTRDAYLESGRPRFESQLYSLLVADQTQGISISLSLSFHFCEMGGNTICLLMLLENLNEL